MPHREDNIPNKKKRQKKKAIILKEQPIKALSVLALLGGIFYSFVLYQLYRYNTFWQVSKSVSYLVGWSGYLDINGKTRHILITLLRRSTSAMGHSILDCDVLRTAGPDIAGPGV